MGCGISRRNFRVYLMHSLPEGLCIMKRKILFATSALLALDYVALKAEVDESVTIESEESENSSASCPATLLDDATYVESLVRSVEEDFTRGRSDSWKELMSVVDRGSLSELQKYKEENPEKYQEGLVRAGDNYSLASHFIGHNWNGKISPEDREGISKMLLRDTGPDLADSGGWTPVMHAAHVGKKELVRFAVEECHSKTASTAVNFQNKNAAYFALTSGRCSWSDRKEMLETVGGRTDFVSGYNDNLLHILLDSITHRVFNPEDRQARLEVLQKIVTNNSQVKVTQRVAAYDNDGRLLSEDGTTMAYMDCFEGKRIKEVEVERSLLDQQNSAGETALHVAARNSDIDAAVVLLNAGANPNIVSGQKSLGGVKVGYVPMGASGRTPLSFFSAESLGKIMHSVSTTTLARVKQTLNKTAIKEIAPQLQRLRDEGLWK